MADSTQEDERRDPPEGAEDERQDAPERDEDEREDAPEAAEDEGEGEGEREAAEDEDEGDDDSPEETVEAMPAAELAQAAKDSLGALTGYEAESVSGLEWDDGAWVLTVEVCELERVPNTTDVMATYEVRLDERGRLLGYRRTHRYSRGQTEEH